LRGRGAEELAVEFGEVGRDAVANLILDSGAFFEPRGQGALNGRIHGEKGVGNDIEAVERFRLGRPGYGNPGGLHLR